MPYVGQETLDALFSQDDQVIDYYPGRLISGGNMKVLAQARHFLNEASRIVARGEVNIKGYTGIVLKILTYMTLPSKLVSRLLFLMVPTSKANSR